jgi:hypothetical protein
MINIPPDHFFIFNTSAKLNHDAEKPYDSSFNHFIRKNCE